MPDSSGEPRSRQSELAVLQIIPRLDSGGAERATLEITEALVAAGARALIATEGGRLVPALEAAGGTVLSLPLTSKNPLTIIANGFALAKAARQGGVTALHARSRAPAWSALIASKLTGLPLVTTFHGLYEAKGPLKRWYNGVMAKGARVIANSDFTARHVAETYPEARARLVTIPRGVDLAQFDPRAVGVERSEALRRAWNVPATARLVLVPGRITRWKGQDLVIGALAQLRGRGEARDVIAILVGDVQSEAYRATLLGQIERSGLTESVLLVGHCADMPAAYRAAQIVVQPSRRPEAFGRVAAEAEAMGAIVVASDIGAAPETVLAGVTGFLASAGDAEALAGALEQALSLSEFARAGMAARARAHIAGRFALTRMCADTLAVYEAVLHG
jgi:glycosyltransferase involved in cell wall biosynthesis